MESSQARESFRSLLLRDRGRTGLIQRDLAARAGVSLRSVQDWEAGVTLPTAERLQGLIRALLEAGGLTAGREADGSARAVGGGRARGAADAHAFRRAVVRRPAGRAGYRRALRQASANARRQPAPGQPSAPRIGVRRRTRPASSAAPRSWRCCDSWVLEERCRLVAVLGMGGIGKTSLAARLAQDVAPSFERVYWRSLAQRATGRRMAGWRHRLPVRPAAGAADV